MNLPNTGQISDLQSDAVVETNAMIRFGEIRPVTAGKFPRPVRSLIRSHIDTQETIIEASRSGDLDTAFQGFLIDPQIRALAPDDSRDLFAELVAAEEEYLKNWNISHSEVLEESSMYST